MLDYLDHRSSACVGTFAGLYRATLERIEARGFDVFDGPPRLSALTKLRIVGCEPPVTVLHRECPLGPLQVPGTRGVTLSDAASTGGFGPSARPRRVAVVGGGLAGLAAALELADAGHEVVLHEARPTLGGAVQTLPEREGDPPPPPDNGQHIALGCFTEYRALPRADRQGRRAPARAARAARDRRERTGRRSCDRAFGSSATRTCRCPSRLRIARVTLRLRGLTPAAHSDRTFAELLRGFGHTRRRSTASGTSSSGRRSTCRREEAGADYGIFTVQTALLGGRGAGDLLLPVEPLGEMHGDAAGDALREAGADVRLESRVETLDELDADAVIVALRRRGGGPPARRRSARARGLADRQRPPALRPADPPPPARGAARLPCPLGLRPRRADRPLAA